MVEEGCGVGTRAGAAPRRTVTGMAVPAAGATSKAPRGRGGSATIAVMLSCLATAGHASGWTNTNHIASTTAIETSDRADARLEVDCRAEREVRVLHETLEALRGRARIRGAAGWGLDLRRADHHGEGSYWWPCPYRKNCLYRFPPKSNRDIRQLKKSWTLHLRMKPKGWPALDMRFDLAGSAKAIDAACGEGVRP